MHCPPQLISPLGHVTEHPFAVQTSPLFVQF
jgi:hypothetical protein